MCHTSGCKANRRGITIVQVLVVMAILAILVGFFLPSVRRVREAAARTQCINNMKQIGLAMQNFHASQGRYPVEGICTGASLYIRLLPYVDAFKVYQMVAEDFEKAIAADMAAFHPKFGYGNSTTGFVCTPSANILANYQLAIDTIQKAEPKSVVPAYLCPDRRDGKVDYGGVFNVSISDYPAYFLTATIPYPPKYPSRLPYSGPPCPSSSSWLTVVDAPDPLLGPGAVGITAANVSSGAGTGNTILLAHKALAPINYDAPITPYTGTVTAITIPATLGTLNDQGFATTAFTSYAAASASATNPIKALYTTYKATSLRGVDTTYFVYPPQLGYDHMRFADGGAYALTQQTKPGAPTTSIPTTSSSYGSGYTQDSATTCDWAMGGTHVGGAPALMVDGSIRMYNYKYTDTESGFTTSDAAVFQALWAWNRSLPRVQPPDE